MAKLVCLVDLVRLVHLVCFVDQLYRFFQPDKPNKPLRQDKPAADAAPPFHLQIQFPGPHTIPIITRGSGTLYSGRPSLSTFSLGTPDCINRSSHIAACSRSVINTRSNCQPTIPSGEETGQERNDSRELPSINPTQSIFISRNDR